MWNRNGNSPLPLRCYVTNVQSFTKFHKVSQSFTKLESKEEQSAAANIEPRITWANQKLNRPGPLASANLQRPRH